MKTDSTPYSAPSSLGALSRLALCGALLSSCAPATVSDLNEAQSEPPPLVTGVSGGASSEGSEWLIDPSEQGGASSPTNQGAPPPDPPEPPQGPGGAMAGLDLAGGVEPEPEPEPEPPPALLSPELRLIRSSTEALEITTNLPARVIFCDASLFDGLSCDDADEDGLVDQWEDELLEALKPTLRFHPDEQLLRESNTTMLQLGRVSVRTLTPLSLDIRVVTALSQVRAACLWENNPGDLELTYIQVSELEPGRLALDRMIFSEHSSDFDNWFDTVTTAQIPNLTTVTEAGSGLLRWIAYSFKGKHTLFQSPERCQSIISISACRRYCPSDVSQATTQFDLSLEILNAGEPSRARVTDLAPYGFAGEQVWSDERFCGGDEGARDSRCFRKSIQELLTSDP